MAFKVKIKKLAQNVIMRYYALTKSSGSPSVFFSSFSSMQYSDSPKAISEKLHELAPDLRIVWCISSAKADLLPSYACAVEPGTRQSLLEQAAASAWVFNGVMQKGTYKSRRTFYVQTWHGDRPLKKVGHDAAQSMGKKKYTGRSEFSEPKICDLYLIGSEAGRRQANSAFGYYGNFLKAGIPKNDILVNPDLHCEKAKEIRKILGIADSTKVLLYAPTVRDNLSQKQVPPVDLVRTADTLGRSGDDWVCLVRAHAHSAGIDTAGDSRITDVTDYPDMADLLLIADLLITDYSSSATDFILTRRPVILAQFDIEDYSQNARSLSYDCRQAGFLVAHNRDEFDDIIARLWEYDHAQISRKINDFFDVYESGNSTEEVCALIIDWCRNQK